MMYIFNHSSKNIYTFDIHAFSSFFRSMVSLILFRKFYSVNKKVFFNHYLFSQVRRDTYFYSFFNIYIYLICLCVFLFFHFMVISFISNWNVSFVKCQIFWNSEWYIFFILLFKMYLCLLFSRGHPFFFRFGVAAFVLTWNFSSVNCWIFS